MRILILGAGAIGGYFGGRLAASGADVTFLVRDARRALLRENGLRIVSPALGDAHIPDVQTVTASELPGAAPFDIVVLTCKAYDLDSAMEAIAPAADAGAAVLPLLNGLGHLEILSDRFGRDRVLGGLAKIAATLSEDGAIQHLNDWNYITFGEQDGADSDRTRELKALFDKTPVVAAAVPDIVAKMWEKFVHLVTIASMTCLMRASVGEIARTPEGTAILKETFEEIAAVSGAHGTVIGDAFRREYHAIFENKDSSYTASMLRDLEHGGRIEADAIVGYALGAAKAAGIATPLLRVAYTHLKAYEERRKAGRL